MGSAMAQALGQISAATHSAAPLRLFFEEVVGELIAQHCHLVSLIDGTLTVRVDHPQWCRTLQERHDELLVRMQRVVGVRALKQLIFETARA